MLLDILSRLGSNCRGLACYSISYHALAVTAEAWHATLYPITPWQYLPRLVSTDMAGKGSGAYFMRMVARFQVSRAAEEEVLYWFSGLRANFAKVFFPK